MKQTLRFLLREISLFFVPYRYYSVSFKMVEVLMPEHDCSDAIFVPRQKNVLQCRRTGMYYAYLPTKIERNPPEIDCLGIRFEFEVKFQWLLLPHEFELNGTTRKEKESNQPMLSAVAA